MTFPKTKALRSFRRERAEAVQARSAARPLEERVRSAGLKERAKFVRRLGAEAVHAILGIHS